MSENGRALGLETAERMAAEIMERLRPHCSRIEVAGSIRRRREIVNDIDLVAIPQMTSKWTMFSPGDVTETDFADELKEIVVPANFGQKILRGFTRVSFWKSVGPVSVDVYIAEPETWAGIFLIRTGSAEHNIWLASRAKSCGGTLHADGSGLELPGQYDPLAQRTINMLRVKAESEERIFSGLGLPTPNPEEREVRNGKPVWMGGAA